MGGEVRALFLKALSVLGEGAVREKRLWIISQAMIFVLGNVLIGYGTLRVMFDHPIVLYFTPILFTGIFVAIVVIGWKKKLFWIDPNTEGREIAIEITITTLSLVTWIRILYKHYEIMRYWWM